MTQKIEDYEGNEIFVDGRGIFHCLRDGKDYHASSLAALRGKLNKLAKPIKVILLESFWGSKSVVLDVIREGRRLRNVNSNSLLREYSEVVYYDDKTWAQLKALEDQIYVLIDQHRELREVLRRNHSARLRR